MRLDGTIMPGPANEGIKNCLVCRYKYSNRLFGGDK